MTGKIVPEGRVGCVNPKCRRTYPRARTGDVDSVVCRRCWNDLPQSVRTEHKRLNRINAKLERMSRKPSFGEGRPDQWSRILAMYDRRADKLNGKIDRFFVDGENPTGLESFLEEIGLDG